MLFLQNQDVQKKNNWKTAFFSPIFPRWDFEIGKPLYLNFCQVEFLVDII